MTLADSLITIFILTLVIGTLMGVYFTYNNVIKVQIAYNELNANSTIALNKISKNVRQASSVVDATTINSTNYSTDHDTLILELPSIDSDQKIISNSYDYLVYFIDPADSTKLKSDIEPSVGSSRSSGEGLISEFVESITFNYNETDYLSINEVETVLVTTQSAGHTEQKMIIQSSVKLRNN